ncbi:hypothetical protein GCM10007112_18770 [Vulcanisaeta souniana JCM 11219]|nr:hypothetical protein GCM10007112_18770 [Vulcanisaeta souniana JCM 11219]
MIPLNASLTYIGNAFSISIYQVNSTNSSGYLIATQGEYQGDFVGVLRIGNATLIGTYSGVLVRSVFTGYFMPIASYESIRIPTVLALSNYTYFEATVQSKVPVYLRYLVFNVYGNGTLLNTLPLITVEASMPPLTIWFSNGYDCSEYRINATYGNPMQVVPIPVVINTQPPLTYFVSNVSIVGTSPQTELMLLEPGDVVVAESPVTAVNYTMYVCKEVIGYPGSEYGLLYAMEYLGPGGISIPSDISNNVFRVKYSGNDSMVVVNHVFSVLSSGKYSLVTYSVGPGNLFIAGKGSVIDFAAAAMAVLRNYGIPTRIALGFYGTNKDGLYFFNSAMGILWDESYVGDEWVMYMPIPSQVNSVLGPIPGNEISSVITGLILALPWIVGFLIYLLISKVKTR